MFREIWPDGPYIPGRNCRYAVEFAQSVRADNVRSWDDAPRIAIPILEERVIRIILVTFAAVIHICAGADGPNVSGRNGADSCQRVIRTEILPALRIRTRRRAPARTVPSPRFPRTTYGQPVCGHFCEYKFVPGSSDRRQRVVPLVQPKIRQSGTCSLQ